MIYIPGGGFFDGDGSNEYYGPDLLMMLDHKMPDKNKKIIFVTMNYRLGPFGFLNLDEPGLTGNMGFKDQQLAIEWVYNNIEFFGGNNKYITLIGESAGTVNKLLFDLYFKSKVQREFIFFCCRLNISALSFI